jgi:hypothetical protein
MFGPTSSDGRSVLQVPVFAVTGERASHIDAFFYLSRSCSIDSQPASRVHPHSCCGAQRSDHLVPGGHFEPYATAGPRPPSDYFRRPGLWDQFKDTPPLNSRRNPAYSRMPLPRRFRSLTRYIALFIRHFARTFCELLLVRGDSLDEAMPAGHAVDCTSHSLGPCILGLFPFGTCNANTRKRARSCIRAAMRRLSSTRGAQTCELAGTPYQVRGSLHDACLDPDDILTFQVVKLVLQEPWIVTAERPRRSFPSLQMVSERNCTR